MSTVGILRFEDDEKQVNSMWQFKGLNDTRNLPIDQLVTNFTESKELNCRHPKKTAGLAGQH
jgi:hypothetical protein